LKFGFHHILIERVYLPGQPIPSNHDLWEQRHNCGQVVPFYEAKKESKLQDFVETSDNPFDVGETITGLDNKCSIKDYNKNFKKKKKELEDKLSRIPDEDEDEDIKDEIRKENIVTIIGDSFDY
jgi:hypothetical protein